MDILRTNSFFIYYIIVNCSYVKLTLSPYKNERNFLHVSKLRHLHIVVVDGVETCFIFKTEYKNDRINPACEL